MAYDVGQKVRVELSIVDLADEPADTNLSVAVLAGDLSPVAAPTVEHDGLGAYHFDVVATTTGLWSWYASATTPIQAARSGQFFVRSGGPRLLSLQEARLQLNKTNVSPSDDEEILDLVDTVTSIVEDIVGPVIPRVVTEVHDGGQPVIYLRHSKVIAVTSVTEAWGVGDVRVLTERIPGTSEPADGFQVDLSLAALYRSTGSSRTRFYGGRGGVTVSLIAGRTVIRPNFRTAAGAMLTHVWRQTQYAQGSTRPRADATDTTIVMGYAIPNRVLELLGRQKRAPRLGRSA